MVGGRVLTRRPACSVVKDSRRKNGPDKSWGIRYVARVVLLRLDFLDISRHISDTRGTNIVVPVVVTSTHSGVPRNGKFRSQGRIYANYVYTSTSLHQLQ